MSVKLRLTRIGAKKAPCYRIVALDSRKARDGKYIEQIGFYNPVSNPVDIRIDADLAKKWIAFGAQPTETVRDLLVKQGIIEKKTIRYPAKKAEPKEAEAAEEKPAENK
jgi:small subunit ribosomal protein S16